MLAVVSNWLTPTSLFLFLNLVIGTIAVTARLASHKKPLPHHQQHGHPHQIARSPSFLERVRSIDFYSYKFSPFNSESGTQTPTGYATHDDPHPTRFERVPSLLERVKSIKFSSFYRSESETEPAAEVDADPLPGKDHSSDSVIEHEMKRSKSESRVVQKRHVQEKMKKSASEVAVVDAEEEEEDGEEVDRRRPAITRMTEKTVSSEDEGVDAKADDFINKFKQHLRLQRLDSLLRYKEMLKAKQK